MAATQSVIDRVAARSAPVSLAALQDDLKNNPGALARRFVARPFRKGGVQVGYSVREIGRQIQAEFNEPPTFVIGRSVNDASHFTVYGGIPTLLYGPQGGNTCKANECLDVDSLLPQQEFI